MPLRACPDCSTEVSTTAATCPKCGHSFWAPRLVRGIFLFLGIAICLFGAAMLYLVAQPPIGLGPFTSWPRNQFNEAFLLIRRAGFGAIALGLIISVGGYLVLRRLDSKR